MGLSNSIALLSRIIERCESDGGQVHRVDATITGQDGDADSNVTVDVAVPLCSSATEGEGGEPTPQTATLAEDGGIRLEFPPSLVPAIDQYAPDSVSSEKEDVHVAADGTVLVTFGLGFGEDGEPDRAETETASSTDGVTELDADTKSTVPDAEPDGANGDGSESVGRSARCVDEPVVALSTEGADGDETVSFREPNSDDETETSLDPETERALQAARNEDLPPYDDDEYLQCVYDSFDTFTAMADVVEMDVASETIRRYMIDADIHEPSSYDTTAADRDDEQGTDRNPANEIERPAEEQDESPAVEDADARLDETESEFDRPNEADDPVEGLSEKQLVADGIGLPGEIEIEELMEAIESSMTLYDVQRELGLDHSRTRELLEQLNLIDLVMKRVYGSDEPERTPSRNEIADRIRESVASER